MGKDIYLYLKFGIIGIMVVGLSAFVPKGGDEGCRLEDVAEAVGELDGFETEIVKGTKFGFPEYLGDGTLYIHPNSMHRGRILELLDCLPDETLVYGREEDGACERIYGERSGDDGYIVVYVILGTGGGDSGVLLFRDVDEVDYNKFVNFVKND